MELFEAIHTRRSVRKFTDEQVSREDLLKIITAGMAAPSAKNVQPWSFIIITNKTIMLEMCGYLPNAQMLKTAAAAIVVCGVLDKDEAYAKKHWTVDCAAATENMLLAAHALRLGAVWTATYPNEERTMPLRKTLNLPPNIESLCVIPLGHVGDNIPPKDKFDKNNIHWEQW